MSKGNWNCIIIRFNYLNTIIIIRIKIIIVIIDKIYSQIYVKMYLILLNDRVRLVKLDNPLKAFNSINSIELLLNDRTSKSFK